MADDTEFIKLPLLQRCSHKLWKARLHGYTEAAKLFDEEVDEKAPIFGQFTGLLGKFAGDSNAVAQEKGLEATLQFVRNSTLAGKTVKDVMSVIVSKCIAASKKGTQELSVQIILMYIEQEKQEVVVEELLKGLEAKNPKIVAACVSALTNGLREFGSGVVLVKPLIKPTLTLLEDRDKGVRDEAKGLTVEIYRWIGDALKPQLANLKPIQLTELETEFSKVKGKKAIPTRYLRSQQEKAAKAAAIQSESGDGDDVENCAEVEIDPLSLVDPINVLSKIPNDIYENIESKKWQDRRDALISLDKILDYPKFEKGDYGDLVRALMKVVSKDSNVVVVGFATKCVARLVSGLKKGFQPYAHATLSQLLAKFKEKKSNVVNPLREAVDAIFPITTLENIQEDVFASLDSKNPSIKAETTAFVGRSFAQCTATVLNKKILKAYATALLKTLNDTDPLVRDNSAEALGTAMKVVGEKAMMPFLPDIDPIKLTKIKECCEKAVIKFNHTAAKPAPKAVAVPVKAEPAPKKVLSGGAIAKQAPKVQKPIPLEKEMTVEEVDEKAIVYLGEDVLKNLGDVQWGTRLDAVEVLQNVLTSMEPNEVAGEVMLKVLNKKPGLKDNNFQVIKLKLDCLKYIAENLPIGRGLATSVVADVTEKLSDLKNFTLAGETLMALAEVTNLDIVGSLVLEYAFSQKSVKIQQEALDWMSEAIQNFGFIVSTSTLIGYVKKGLNSTNAGVRTSAASLSGILSIYLGDRQLLQLLDEKPAVMNLVNAEIEKHVGEEPLEPTRSCKIKVAPEEIAIPLATRQISEEPVEEKPKETSKPTARVDISLKITEQLLAELGGKNWKDRNEALVTIQGIVNDAKNIKSTLGELPPLLCQRFVDNNGKIVVAALELCTSLATAMGPGSKNQIRSFARGIFIALGDNKVVVRTAALVCLKAWAQEAGIKEFFQGEIIPEAFKTGSTALRIELWNWLGEVLPTVKGLPKDEMALMIPYLFTALEDRNVEVRKAGNTAVFGMMSHLGYHNLAKEVEKLKPASKAGIQQILDKVRPDVIEATPVKEKADVKPKAGAPPKAGKPKMSVGQAPKPTSRKKEEEADTSPLLVVNKLKNQRVLDEQKLKTLRWNFTTPRPEFVELLRDQMTAAGFNKTLTTNMFHSDFKLHLKAIESLSDDLENEEALIANLDLIIKWMTLRFFDTNPSVLLKGLEYLHSAFTILIGREYTMFDVEANAFIPYLVLKIGDTKDAVRDRVHSILKQFSLMYIPGKLFLLIMDGLKSKNSRQRTECLDELGYLIEQYGTSVCLPSPTAALKEISKQIGDRDNSVRSAALNAIVKAYFVDGEKIYKMIGKLSDKDMAYLEERIKRASQNRTKMQKLETTRVEPTRCEPEVSPVREPEPVEEQLEDVEPEPRVDLTPASSVTRIWTNSPISIIPALKMPTCPKLIEIDDSFLDDPIYIPEYLRAKMNLNRQPPSNPVVEAMIRDISSLNLDVAFDGARKLDAVLDKEVGEKLGVYAQSILDSLVAQLKAMNTYSTASHGPVLRSLYKVILRIIDQIFKKKTAIGQAAEEHHLKTLMQELVYALVCDRTAEFHEGGYNQWLALFITRIIENSDLTKVTCAAVNAMFDLVAHPPSNPKLTDITTKCLLKVIWVIRRTDDLDPVIDLDRVLYSCHVFMQAYPRYSWKDRPSDVPLKAIKTLLSNLVTKKGADILTHTRSIENPISSELTAYLKKLLKTQGAAVGKRPYKKLTTQMSDHLSEVFMKIAHEESAKEGMLQFYEFKKQNPDVDLTAILAPTTPFFKDYVAEGLREIERERGPLENPIEIQSKSSPSNINDITVSTPPSDYNQAPLHYLKILRTFQERNGLPLTSLEILNAKSENKI